MSVDAGVRLIQVNTPAACAARLSLESEALDE
jgi:hypothetical protein